MNNTPKFEHFIERFTALIDTAKEDEQTIFAEGERLLADLIGVDDWLQDCFAQPDERYYQQYLLHLDPLSRFSVVSFVWGPGQFTPIHDHGVWALIGMLRGSERSELFGWDGDGKSMRLLREDVLRPGTVERVSPQVGDIHRVSNVFDDQVSISVHVYGGDIGKLSRHAYDGATGGRKPFVSGYTAPKSPA